MRYSMFMDFNAHINHLMSWVPFIVCLLLLFYICSALRVDTKATVKFKTTTTITKKFIMIKWAQKKRSYNFINHGKAS